MSGFLPYLGIVAVMAAFVAAILVTAVKAIDGDGWPYGVASVSLLVFGLALIFWAMDQEDSEGPIHSWPGGDGPNTVCWYAEKDNPDTYVNTGKVMMPIDGGTSLYTYCGPKSEVPG